MRAGEVRRRQPDVCAPRSTWRRRISICAIRSCIGYCARLITAPAISGASIRPTTSPTANRIPSKASRIRSVRWSSRITGRSTIGFSIELADSSSAADRIRPAQSDPHRAEQAQAPAAGPAKTMLAAGTIRECRRWPAYAAAAIRRRRFANFCERIGVAKANSTVDIAMLEHSLREDLNKRAPRVMAVLRPIKVVLENYPEGQVEELEAVNNPEDPARARARCRSPASFTSSRTISVKSLQRVFPSLTRQRGASAVRLHHQVHRSRKRSQHR